MYFNNSIFLEQTHHFKTNILIVVLYACIYVPVEVRRQHAKISSLLPKKWDTGILMSHS